MNTRAMALLLLLSGCGITGGDEVSGEGALSAAWTQFQRGNYEVALAAFDDLAADGALLPEALEGQGWCRLMLGQATQAAPVFRQSLLADENRHGARAGEAFARRDSSPPDYPRVISQARETLRRQPAFRFSYNTRIDWLDLHLLMAQAFFYQQAFDSSLGHCRIIDPGLALTAQDTLSWGEAGSFESALFLTLQDLGAATAP